MPNETPSLLDKLAPCPFCGCADVVYGGQLEGVNCRGCRAQLFGAGVINEREIWNRRTHAQQSVEGEGRAVAVVGTVHELKCWPPYYAAVLDHSKPFEVRQHDRDFKVNDLLRLREFEPGRNAYTGREFDVQISYITNFAQADGNVVLGLRYLHPPAAPAPQEGEAFDEAKCRKEFEEWASKQVEFEIPDFLAGANKLKIAAWMGYLEGRRPKEQK